MRNLVIRHNGNQIRFNLLEWDTAFFGIRSFLLDLPSLVVRKNSKEFTKIITNALGRSFIVAKIPSICPRKITDFLVDLGFRYINTEIILEFDNDKDLNRNDFKVRDMPGIVIEKAKAVPDDAYRLGREYSLSRFHLDKNIAKRTADAVWVDYIRNFKLDAKHHLFTTRIGNKTIGSIFVKQYVESGTRVCNLFSVSLIKKYRGKGIGSALLKYTVLWCRQHSKRIIAGTQSNNINACNFYIKNGFSKIRKTKIILHRWNRA